ncbi:MULTISPECIES: hypothetical protein [unclassified Nocardiopsis]|uniref:hypothetical protein n=1 Tax=Nocardiopsis TaxID=2013 RepID=UPI00387B47B6
MWYGLWFGGCGYSPSDPLEDIEKFPTLNAARDALRDRFRDGASWRQEFEFVNRDPEKVFTPAVSEDSEILLFATPDGDAYPDQRVYFGPLGGVRVENC